MDGLNFLTGSLYVSAGKMNLSAESNTNSTSNSAADVRILTSAIGGIILSENLAFLVFLFWLRRKMRTKKGN